MSSDRSSSAVRNLRSLFENKHQDDPTTDTRGRSPSGRLANNVDSNGRPLSKVRASFVCVDPSGQMATSAPADMPEMGRENSLQTRRMSFSMNETNEGTIADLKREISNESQRRASDPNVAETIPETVIESVAGTPAVERREDEAMGYFMHAASKLSAMQIAPSDENEPPANPDKPTTGAEEEEGAMKAAEPTNEDAVSGGEALPPVQEDLRKHPETNGLQTSKMNGTPVQPATTPKSTTKPATNGTSTTSKATLSNGKPASISTKAASKAPAAGSIKSPNSLRESPVSSKTPLSPKAGAARDLTRKTSRSSLAAPTAASVARAASSEMRESLPGKASSPSIKSRPREATKAADVSSRLLAPTASSKARQDIEGASKSAAPAPKPLTAARLKAQSSSVRPTPRSSLAASQRPESRTSQTARRTAAPPDGSFLDRMTRPTASSSSRVHEKVEVKSPPRRNVAAPAKKSVAPKTNGAVKNASKTSTSSKVPASKTEEKVIDHARVDKAEASPAPEVNGAGEDAIKTAEDAKIDAPVDAAEGIGNETPIPDSSTHLPEGALESTPVFGEEGIR